MARLSKENVNEEICREIFTELKNNSVESLVIQNSTFNPEIIRSLNEGLKQNNSLTNLDLLSITIPSMNETILTDIFRNIKVARLVLNRFNYPSATALNKIIFQALQSNTTIREISICNMGLNLDDLWALFTTIKENNTIETFIFSQVQQIDLKGAKMLQEIIETKKNIRWMNLIDCSITDQICTYIAEGLKQNQTLRFLDLSENHINGSGIIALCNSLKTNTTLTYLCLSDNMQYSIPALTAVKDMLACNTTIRYLWLSNCYHPREENEVALICSGLKLNESLTFVDLWSSDIPDDPETIININHAIESVLDVNYGLRKVEQYKNNDAIKQRLNRNQNLQAEMLYKIAILVHNIARSKEPIGGLPNELWLEIFSRARQPGLDPVINNINLFHRIQSGAIVRVTGSSSTFK